MPPKNHSRLIRNVRSTRHGTVHSGLRNEERFTMLNTGPLAHPALDPGDAVIYGAQIDRDLGITDRGRRKMIARGALPAPDGYFAGRAFWRVSRYVAFKTELLAGKHGQPRRPGIPLRAA
jgi:hypothetical protein